MKSDNGYLIYAQGNVGAGSGLLFLRGHYETKEEALKERDRLQERASSHLFVWPASNPLVTCRS